MNLDIRTVFGADDVVLVVFMESSSSDEAESVAVVVEKEYQQPLKWIELRQPTG
jgi:hypothetical protein